MLLRNNSATLLLELLQEADAYFGFFGVAHVWDHVEAGDFAFFVFACCDVDADGCREGTWTRSGLDLRQDLLDVL